MKLRELEKIIMDISKVVFEDEITRTEWERGDIHDYT